MSFQGKVNVYTCEKCEGRTVTIDRDEGVTPFILRCRVTPRCDGKATSCCYRPPPGTPPPTHEWYRPTEKEAKRSGEGMYEHFKAGGLFIRPVTQGDA